MFSFNLNVNNILYLYVSFFTTYFIVLFLTIICNKYYYRENDIYNNQIIDIEKDIDLLNNDYKLFCCDKDKYLKNKIRKEFVYANNHFLSMKQHLKSEFEHEFNKHASNIKNIQEQLSKLIFNK